MVGDSLKRDMAAAKKLGILAVFAKYGGNYEPFIVEPDCTIEKISDLRSVLERI